MLASAREPAHGTVVHPRARPRAASPPSISEPVAVIQLSWAFDAVIICVLMLRQCRVADVCRWMSGMVRLRIARSLCR